MKIPAIGQESTQVDINKNELKLNIGYLIIPSYAKLRYPELTYERIINNSSGIGISFGYSFENDLDLGIEYIITPFYRYYFGEKRASGFYAEGNTAFFAVRDPEFSNGLGNGFGVGAAIGVKFLIKQVWILEIYIGGGRNFINNDIISEVYPRWGIALGRRF